METQYSHTRNAWHQFGLPYAPCARHQGYTSSNMLFADGHLGKLGDEYNTVNDFPFKFR